MAFEFLQRLSKYERKNPKVIQAPDLSGFDKRLELVSQKSDVLQQEISMIIQEVQLVSDVANELKGDLRQDVRRMKEL